MQPGASPWGPPPSVPPPPPRLGPEGWYLGPDGEWYRSALPPAPGWWLASDLRWYPPELAAGVDDGERPRWGLGDVAWGFLVFVAGSIVLGLVIGIAIAIADDRPLTEIEVGPYAIAFGLLANVAAFAGVPWLAARRKGSGSLTRDFGLAFRPIDLAIGLGFGLAALVGAAIVGGALTALLDPDGETTNVPVDSLDGVGEIVVFALAIAIVTPIIEELFFRGLLARSLTKRGMGTLANGVVTTLVFVLPHLLSQPEWPNVLVLFGVITCFGAMFHAATVVTGGRLGAAIVAHMIVNGVAVIVLAVG